MDKNINDWTKIELPGVVRKKNIAKPGHTYAAEIDDIEETNYGEEKYRITYKGKNADGESVYATRNVKKEKLREWVENHTGFDPSAKHPFQKISKEKHLITIGEYEGYPFVEKVSPM